MPLQLSRRRLWAGASPCRSSTRGGPAPIKVEHYTRYLDILWDAFGEDRMVFGSDWPVSDYSERSYADVLELAQAYVATKPLPAKAKVFSENARHVYKWVDRT